MVVIFEIAALAGPSYNILQPLEFARARWNPTIDRFLFTRLYGNTIAVFYHEPNPQECRLNCWIEANTADVAYEAERRNRNRIFPRLRQAVQEPRYREKYRPITTTRPFCPLGFLIVKWTWCLSLFFSFFFVHTHTCLCVSARDCTEIRWGHRRLRFWGGGRNREEKKQRGTLEAGLAHDACRNWMSAKRPWECLHLPTYTH